MKPMTLAFLILQGLDLIITAVGVWLGLAIELNPMGFTALTVLIKAIVVALIAAIIERVKLPAVWVLPGISGLAVAWNLLVLIVEAA